MVLSLVKSKPPHRPPPTLLALRAQPPIGQIIRHLTAANTNQKRRTQKTQTETPVNVQRCALRHGGLDRVFYMYIPTSYTSSSDNQPLLFSLHGYTSSALTNLSYTGFESPANANWFHRNLPPGIDSTINWSDSLERWGLGLTSSTTDDVNYIENNH
ncbi:MAG: hypothetical protein Ct9H90mP27_4390 [Gammaproteobacteria bacterium]|nr:MAG: hypothetical protein Ct9H90mP27_4390 [Gammaproteobacteria bacterium]